jgi:hypothetical protein
MIPLRTTVGALLIVMSLGRLAAAQETPAPEPAAPPVRPPPPSPYNPPAPPPYTGPTMNTGSLGGEVQRLHDGFYLRLSLGAGTLATSGDLDPDDGSTFETRGGCVALDLAIGGTPVPGFVIGGNYAFQESFQPHIKVKTSSFSVEQNADANTVFSLFGAFVDWFPDPRGGFHVGGTLGYAVLSTADENGDVESTASETGFGGALRVGYDFWVSSQWSLGVLGQFVGGRVRGDSVNSFTERDSVGSFAVLFTALYH